MENAQYIAARESFIPEAVAFADAVSVNPAGRFDWDISFLSFIEWSVRRHYGNFSE